MPRKYLSNNRLGEQKKLKENKLCNISFAGNNTGDWSSKDREEHATDSRATEVCSRGRSYVGPTTHMKNGVNIHCVDWNQDHYCYEGLQEYISPNLLQ